MRKLLSTAVVVIALLFATNAQAQVKFGLKGGLNVTSMSFSEDVIQSSNQAGFYVGPTLKFTLPLVGLGVDAAALYDQRSAEVNGEKIKNQAISIPVNLRYNIGLGSLAGIYLAAGPQFGFNVGDDEFKWSDSKSYQNMFQMKKSNFSVNLGAGVSLLKHVEVGFKYNIVCGKTGDINVLDAAGKAISNTAKGRYNSWQVGLAYYF
uniref:Porin family protein n=1 Tax=Prevotella sp. GTC17259 TaxID=3236795 RepID=A0AB33JAL8_9BACT